MSKTPTRVYVGHVSQKATERDLERFFQGHGKIKKVFMKTGYCFVDFEDFRDAEDAVYALNGTELFKEKVIIEIARGTPRGRDRVGFRPPPLPPSSAPSAGWGPRDDSHKSSHADNNGHRSRSPRDRDRDRGRDSRSSDRNSKTTRIIVENLSTRVSLRDLKHMFRQVGDVTNVEVYQRIRNEGIIEFASSANVRDAIRKYDGQLFQGRKLRVYEEEATDVGRNGTSPRNLSKSKSKSPSVTKTASAANASADADADAKSNASSPNRDTPNLRSPSVKSRDSSVKSDNNDDDDDDDDEDGEEEKSEDGKNKSPLSKSRFRRSRAIEKSKKENGSRKGKETKIKDDDDC